MKQTIKVTGMSCAHCEARVEAALKAAGATRCKASAKKGCAVFEGDGLTAEKAVEVVKAAGYGAEA